MPAYRARVLVLRKTKLGETDVILTLLAEDGRQVRAVAKGMRKPGSRFGGRLEPGSVADVLLHRGRTLDVVTEATTVDAHAAVRSDLDRQAAAAVVGDLLEKVSLQGQGEERLFGLGVATLDAIGTAEPCDLTALVTAFVAKALAMQGLRPALEECASCASEVGGSASFSVQAGGVLCSQCASLDASCLVVPQQARLWLQRLLQARMAEIPGLRMPREAADDCFELIRAFSAHHLHVRLKALEYYSAHRDMLPD